MENVVCEMVPILSHPHCVKWSLLLIPLCVYVCIVCHCYMSETAMEMNIHFYVCMYVCMCVYMYMYMYACVQHHRVGIKNFVSYSIWCFVNLRDDNLTSNLWLFCTAYNAVSEHTVTKIQALLGKLYLTHEIPISFTDICSHLYKYKSVIITKIYTFPPHEECYIWYFVLLHLDV